MSQSSIISTKTFFMAFPEDEGAVMLLFPIFVESNKKVLLSNVFPTRRALVRKNLKVYVGKISKKQ